MKERPKSKNASILSWYRPVSQSQGSSQPSPKKPSTVSTPARTPSRTPSRTPNRTPRLEPPKRPPLSSPLSPPPPIGLDDEAQPSQASQAESNDSFPALPSPVGRPPASSLPGAETSFRSNTSSFSRDMVIMASDDEDDGRSLGPGSDSSDLDDGIRVRTTPWAAREDFPTRSREPLSSRDKGSNPCVTPKAKRTAFSSSIHSSPLTIRQAAWPKSRRPGDKPPPEEPKHMFDMKALLSHAAKDNAAEAAAQKASALFENRVPTPKKSVSALREHLMDFVGTGRANGAGASSEDDEGSEATNHKDNKERLKRAFERTEVTAVREQWYFFKEYFTPPAPSRKVAFPKHAAAASSRWAFLQDDKLRRCHFEGGFVEMALRRRSNLPDELFLWLMDEICREPLEPLRARYVAAIALCPKQVHSMLDPERVCQFFNNIGSRWESTDLETRLETVRAISNPYPDRSWSHLRSILRLLAQVAGDLRTETVSCAVKLLLRLGMDTIVEENMDVLLDYQEAVRCLLTLPLLPDWDDFCYDVCTSLYDSVNKASLRWQVVACLPAETPRAHELRRRLASVFFFDDPERASKVPDEDVTLKAVAERLEAREFATGPRTDYPDLAALVRLLDVAVDDASRGAFASSVSGDGTSSHNNNSHNNINNVGGNSPVTEAEAAFNADVDRLARRLKALWQGIEASGGAHVSRLDAKTALDCVQKRLVHAIRTRRQPKASIFDPASARGQEEAARERAEREAAVTVPRQQEFMKRFFQKGKGKGGGQPASTAAAATPVISAVSADS